MVLPADQTIQAVKGRLKVGNLALAFKADPSLVVPVFSWSGARIIVSSLRGISSAGEENVVQIYLDDGKSVVCSERASLLLRYGSFKNPQELEAGESLMPLYLTTATHGYPLYKDLIPDPKVKRFTWRKVAWLVGEWKHGSPLPPGASIFHIDKNRRNVNPDNLDIRLNSRSPKRKMTYGIVTAVREAADLFEDVAEIGDRFKDIVDDNNHKCVRVEPAGRREVFDLDVDGDTVVSSGVFIGSDD